MQPGNMECGALVVFASPPASICLLAGTWVSGPLTRYRHHECLAITLTLAGIDCTAEDAPVILTDDDSESGQEVRFN